MKRDYKRLTQPLVRDADGLRPASWDEALVAPPTGFREVIERHGPELRAVQLFEGDQRGELPGAEVRARVIGSHNVDSCNRT